MQRSPGSAPGDYAFARRRLVDQLKRDGVSDRHVLAAFRDVPRHLLIPEALRGQAYRNTPLPIGERQTISAPGVVAHMTQALALGGDETVLEIGTGSGFQAAILSRLARSVVSVERIPVLANAARVALARLGATNVTVHLGDGTRGRPGDAPFDRIVVTAGGPEIPLPLLSQLTIGGMLVGPFGEREAQELIRMRRVAHARFTREVLGPCRFVDLIGENGWAAA
jgi:protein-L-isoaspartate(D-aspartate) O-methyltransferase